MRLFSDLTRHYILFSTYLHTHTRKRIQARIYTILTTLYSGGTLYQILNSPPIHFITYKIKKITINLLNASTTSIFLKVASKFYNRVLTTYLRQSKVFLSNKSMYGGPNHIRGAICGYNHTTATTPMCWTPPKLIIRPKITAHSNPALPTNNMHIHNDSSIYVSLHIFNKDFVSTSM